MADTEEKPSVEEPSRPEVTESPVPESLAKRNKLIAIGAGLFVGLILLVVLLKLLVRHQQTPIMLAQRSMPTVQHTPRKGVPPVISQRVVSLVASLTKGTAVVKYVYPGPDGLIGVMWTTQGGTSRIGWASPDGAVIIPGAVLQADGRDLTMEANQALHGKPVDKTVLPAVSSDGHVSPKAAALLFEGAKHMTYFETGSGKQVVYVFADPDCVYCHDFWERFGKNQHTVRLRWILVGFLNKDNGMAKAATILAAKNPERAFAYNEKHFDVDNESGGSPVKYAADKSQVAAATKLLGESTGVLATPTFVWQDSAGVDHSFMSSPKDLNAFVKEITK